MYEGRHPDSYRRSLFRAKYQGKVVVVKFYEWYGEDAQRGLEPRLYYCSKVIGGVAVMGR